MAGPNLPTGVTTNTTGHVAHTNTVHGIVNAFDTTIASAAGSGHVPTWNGTTYVPAAPVSGASLNSANDHVYYISKSGSDTNNGRSWATPFLTLARAITVNAGFPATYHLGFGTFDESNLVITNGSIVRGSSINGTILRLAASGTLINLDNQTHAALDNLKLEFASSSVTGTLLRMSNAFACTFTRVWMAGTNTAGQVGTHLLGNAGDSTFYSCRWSNMDVHLQNDTTMNTVIGGNFQTSLSAHIQGGDTTGTAAAAGLAVRDSVFGGSTPYYINLNGLSQQWFFDNLWFDAGTSATTGMRIGTATYGPWLVSLNNSYVFGNTTSLQINTAQKVTLDGIFFGNDGANPTEISFPSPANCPRGRIGTYFNTQGNNLLETVVPATWEGWSGYRYYDSGTVSAIQTAEYMDSRPVPLNKLRVVIRVTGRTTGSAAVTVAFPKTFATSQFFKVFDNTGLTGTTLTASSILIPTGQAVSSGMIIIEGW